MKCDDLETSVENLLKSLNPRGIKKINASDLLGMRKKLEATYGGKIAGEPKPSWGTEEKVAQIAWIHFKTRIVFSNLKLPIKKSSRIFWGLLTYLVITQFIAKMFGKPGYFDDLRVTLWTIFIIILVVAFFYRKEVTILDKIFSFFEKIFNPSIKIGTKTGLWIICIFAIFWLVFIFLALFAPQVMWLLKELK